MSAAACFPQLEQPIKTIIVVKASRTSSIKDKHEYIIETTYSFTHIAHLVWW